MALVSNPRKDITVDFTIEEVDKAVSRVHEFTKGKLTSHDSILKEYVISYLFLGMGNIITVSLESVSENKTTVKLEASRLIGAYDKALEVSNALGDIKKVLKSMSQLLSDPSKESPKTREQKKLEKAELKSKPKAEKKPKPGSWGEKVQADTVRIKAERAERKARNAHKGFWGRLFGK
tara:strand:- start:57 stop:590 length:534 start_codon:yes stop_codon:yes gene_type:complete